MKILFTLLSALILTTGYAQSPYEKGMQKAFELWKAQKTDEASNLFERIGKAEKENWIPFYYVAQVNIIKTFNTKDPQEIESRLKKAQEFINEAKTFSKDNAEIVIMEAMMNSAYVISNPSVYGMTHSPKVESLYQKAKALDPKNPRAILYHAEWQMGSAKFWGKDPKAFCPEIEKAISLFDKESSDTPFYPNWGKNDIVRIQKNCE